MDLVSGHRQPPRSEPIFPPSSQEIPSSPPSVASEAGGGRRQRKPPTVTPRSFRRFFTPRSLLNSGSNVSPVRTNRQALRALNSPAVNRLGPAFTRSSKPGSTRNAYDGLPLAEDLMRTPSRKRKHSFSSAASPIQSSPLKKVRVRSPIGDEVEQRPTLRDIEATTARGRFVDRTPASPPKRRPVSPISRSQALRTSGSLFMRTVQGSRANRFTLRSTAGAGWHDLTSDFHSRPEDRHACASQASEGSMALPFCSASCNTNSLVAVGDEEGGIRLLDSSKDDERGFSSAYLGFRPHMNSIMDLEFSSDDLLLATASGDQTSLVIDMTTQRPVHCLSNHVSSVKRIQFQPASNNKVLATCSRDGNVNIWDLRCKGFERPSLQVRCSLETETENSTTTPRKMTYPHVLNTIHGAHAYSTPQKLSTDKTDAPPFGRSDITVTSLAFLPPGQENLFVTASEASASVRLWDLRTAHHNRRGRPVLPLSTTREPDSHMKYRRFGLTSMAFSGEGSRLYTLCRDGTVYTYSTSHLMLGHAPELSLNNNRPRRSGGSDKEGLGPLYGFRHPRLQVSSFYVKLALRKASQDKPEMLAAGSSDHCPILFPTDERFLQSTVKTPDDDLPATRTSLFTTRSGLRRTNSGLGLSGRLEDTIPIYQSGTPLVEGHNREVTAVSWTHDGELISVSDDYSARCWREGPEARELRTGGEIEGRRWECGWAATKDSYDDEDE